MARLVSSGFELNTLTNGLEVTGSGTTPSISSTTFRSGAYALRVNPTAATRVTYFQYADTAAEQAIYFRFALYIATSLGATTTIFETNDNFKGGSPKVGIKMTSGNVLQLWNLEDSAQVGSDSGALSNDTWYEIEMKMDSTTLASTAIEARLNGSSFASGTINLTDSSQTARLGVPASATCDLFYDDVAINDTSGSVQNSWPGSGKIIHLYPDSAGDSTLFTRDGADSGANWSQVDEVTPNDATDYNTSTTLNDEDMFNCAASGLTSISVNLVAVGVRFAGSAGSANPTFKTQIKKTASGTVAQSADITPAGTTYTTHTASVASAVRPYSLIAYTDPDAGAWTVSTLDSMQIGYKLTGDNTNSVRISTVWALVEYTETGGGGSNIKTVSGLPYASVKTVSGLAIASVKNRSGLA